MTKKAHITSRPNHQVGDRVVGLCGKQWKVTVLWDDLPADKPICRKCVDTALKALTEVDAVLEYARRRSTTLLIMAGRLDEELNPDHLMLDGIAELDAAYAQEVESKKAQKREQKRAKRTCVCLWAAGEPIVVRECPVHGEPKRVERGPGGRSMEDVQLPEPKEKGVEE